MHRPDANSPTKCHVTYLLRVDVKAAVPVQLIYRFCGMRAVVMKSLALFARKKKESKQSNQKPMNTADLVYAMLSNQTRQE